MTMSAGLGPRRRGFGCQQRIVGRFDDKKCPGPRRQHQERPNEEGRLARLPPGEHPEEKTSQRQARLHAGIRLPNCGGNAPAMPCHPLPCCESAWRCLRRSAESSSAMVAHHLSALSGGAWPLYMQQKEDHLARFGSGRNRHRPRRGGGGTVANVEASPVPKAPLRTVLGSCPRP